jgi:steroid delta-isomerase-like uncharacterized protein
MLVQGQIDAYFKAWNDRDHDALKALFIDGATYEDPTTRVPIHPYDLAAVVGAIANFMPDFHFEPGTTTLAGDRALTEWLIRGTNSKPIKPGIDATGKSLHLKGVEVFHGTDRFQSVSRIFDQKSLYEQLGMQVIVEPFAQGKTTFGYSKRVSTGNASIPGAVALTWILFRNQSELDRIRIHSARIIQDFLEQPGFISIVTGAAGNRAFTVTAWESEAALYHALELEHSGAKQDFRSSDLATGIWTSVWRPDHINRLWSRCSVCGQPNNAGDGLTPCCHCGAELPPRETYW